MTFAQHSRAVHETEITTAPEAWHSGAIGEPRDAVIRITEKIDDLGNVRAR